MSWTLGFRRYRVLKFTGYTIVKLTPHIFHAHSRGMPASPLFLLRCVTIERFRREMTRALAEKIVSDRRVCLAALPPAYSIIYASMHLCIDIHRFYRIVHSRGIAQSIACLLPFFQLLDWPQRYNSPSRSRLYAKAHIDSDETICPTMLSHSRATRLPRAKNKKIL